jgi:hypothetical protein
VRIRIIKFTKGAVDGIRLDHFQIGETYEVGTTVGSYLLALRAAVPVSDERPPRATPLDLPQRGAKAADTKRTEPKAPRRKR